MNQEINENVRIAVKAFCKEGTMSGRCMPDECEFCPAQQMLNMLDDMGAAAGEQ